MTPRRGRAARRALLGLVAVAATAAVLAWPAQATVTGRYTVWTWNVAGWAMHRGSTTDGLIPTIAGSVQRAGADLAALNELCESQFFAVVEELKADGWPQDPTNFARFEPQDATACGGQPFGVALFSMAPLGVANRFALPSDGSTEGRRLLCAPLLSRPHLRFCTSHITPETTVVNGHRATDAQLDDVHTRLEAFSAAGDTVLIAGDLNAQPHYGRLDDWYSASVDTAHNGSNHGAYRELDDRDRRCLGYGETTTSGTRGGLCGQSPKIDLIFVRADHVVGPYSADSLAIPMCGARPCSDHRTLIGTVRVSVG